MELFEFESLFAGTTPVEAVDAVELHRTIREVTPTIR